MLVNSTFYVCFLLQETCLYMLKGNNEMLQKQTLHAFISNDD